MKRGKHARLMDCLIAAPRLPFRSIPAISNRFGYVVECILKILGKLINVKCLLIVSKLPDVAIAANDKRQATTQIDKRAVQP